MFGLFFFGHFWHDFCLFVFLGKVYLYSLTQLKNVFFFSGAEKKTGFSVTHPSFAEKSKKTNYCREKKYATFLGI